MFLSPYPLRDGVKYQRWLSYELHHVGRFSQKLVSKLHPMKVPKICLLGNE